MMSPRSINSSLSTRPMRRCDVTNRLSLSQRERIEVRDCSRCAFQARARSLEEHYRVLLLLDDSRSGLQQSLVWIRISLAPDHVFQGVGSRDLNHPVRPRASRPDNRNRGCKDRWDAVAGICTVRNSDFEDGAREHARSRSRFCGDNGRESLALV